MRQATTLSLTIALGFALLAAGGTWAAKPPAPLPAPPTVPSDAATADMRKLQADELAKLAARGITPPPGMLLVPAGDFLMGSTDDDPDAQPEEKPQREVHLDAFWIDRTEVTLGDYQAFCKATGRPMPEKPWWAWGPTSPVVNVSREDADAYAKWAGRTLPTEAQWEKACRGVDGRRFHWGEEWPPTALVGNLGPEIAGYTDPLLHPNDVTLNGGPQRPEVGTPWGVLGMTGSAWEWVADWYAPDAYKTGPDKNPTGPETGTLGIVRGGAWYNNIPEPFRCAARLPYDPTIKSAHVGFRCVKSIPPAE
jgi:formylglycine-generating enzyme required for sulfatase activity